MPAHNNSTHDDQFGLVVHRFEKKRRAEIRISINEYKGHRYIDIREFYLNDEGTFAPGKGITVPPDLIGELVHGIALLAEALEYNIDAVEDG
jgi:Transcriptional Coactivator p15 (PC4)